MQTQTLVIYDTTGYILSQVMRNGQREPVGVPFLWLEIPRDKILKSIDVNGAEHKPVYEDLPKSENQKLQEMVDQLIIDNLNMQKQIDTLITTNLEV